MEKLNKSISESPLQINYNFFITFVKRVQPYKMRNNHRGDSSEKLLTLSTVKK